MTELEKEILNGLIELEAAVKTLASATPKPDLGGLLARLDALTLRLPRGTDPNLLHYLHKKSYQKARLFLQGCDEANARGSCH